MGEAKDERRIMIIPLHRLVVTLKRGLAKINEKYLSLCATQSIVKPSLK